MKFFFLYYIIQMISIEWRERLINIISTYNDVYTYNSKLKHNKRGQIETYEFFVIDNISSTVKRHLCVRERER